ncbi:MAG: sulfotransferase [Bacteroidota bacterium]
MIKLPENIKNTPVFFILSRPRTGSTLLRMFFEAHPKVAIPTECPMLIDLYVKYGKIKIWNEKKILKLYKDLIKQWKFKRWDTDFEQLKVNLLKLAEGSSFSDFYKTINLSYNSPYNKTEISIIGDKNPGYSIYCKKIMRIFPQAKFIHLTRDYRNQISSVKKFDFEAPSVSLLSYRWKFVFNKLIKMEIHHPEKFIRVKYENLVDNPDHTMQKICEFLEIPYDNSILNYYNNEKKYLDKYNDDLFKKYFPCLFSPIKASDSLDNNNNLSESELVKASYIIGNCARSAGYQIIKNKPGIITKFIVLFPQIYGYSWYQLKYLYDFMPLSIKKIIGFPTIFGIIYNKLFVKNN